MKDYQSHLETLRKQAAESELISALTTVPQKPRAIREACGTLERAGS
jgi:hypothetical protein